MKQHICGGILCRGILCRGIFAASICALIMSCTGEAGEAYTITFDTGYTEVPNTSVTVYSGEALAALPSPVWSVDSFRGWFDEEENGQMIQAPFAPERSQTLYAYWGAYDLKFDAVEGKVNNSRVTTMRLRLLSSAVKGIPFPSYAGHAFLGWRYVSASDDVPDQKFTYETTVADVKLENSSRTLNAAWAAGSKDFSVTFNGTGGLFDSGEAESKTVTITAPAQVSVGSLWPANPVKDGYVFQKYLDALNNPSALEFTADTKIWEDRQVYAIWVNVDPMKALRLRHDFAAVDGNTVTPAEGTVAAVIKGDGTVGSKTIGDTTWHYFKTGEKLAMNNAAVSYLDLGAEAGAILKSAATAYTIAAYIRTDGDRSGNGSFVWTFASTNAMGSTGAVYFIANSSRNDHNITLAGSGAETRVRQNGVIVNGEWLHVAYTQDGKTGPDNAHLYVNGIEVVKGTITSLPADITAPLVFNTLGGPCYTADYNLSKTMFTDFRIYDAALTAAQVAGLASSVDTLNSVSWDE